MIDQKIAFISDIHGNLHALKAVIEDIKSTGADQIVFLGDAVTLGPDPVAVLDCLQELNCENISGNHDVFMSSPEKVADYTQEKLIFESIDWTRSKLQKKHFEFLDTFRPLFEMSVNEEVRVMAYHGSPASNIERISGPQDFAHFKDLLEANVRTIFVGGHTHHHMLFFSGLHKIANAGSVGMPFGGQGGWGPVVLPFAEYMMLEIEHQVVNIEFKQVSFDISSYKKAIQASNLPLKEWLSAQYR